MLEKVTSGDWMQRPTEGDEFHTWDGMQGVEVKGDAIRGVLYYFDGGKKDVLADWTSLPSSLSLVKESDRLAAKARIEELESKIIRLDELWSDYSVALYNSTDAVAEEA